MLVADTNERLLKQSTELKRLRKIQPNELTSGSPHAATVHDLETALEGAGPAKVGEVGR